MKRTVLASALSLVVAFAAVTPAFAQDVVINADGTVTVNTQPVAGQSFTAQLPSGEIVTLQAQAVATPVVTPVAAPAAATGGVATGGAVAGGAAAGGLGGGMGLAALGALAAVGIIAAVSSASDTN